MTQMKFALKGVHCKACRMLIEDIMEELGAEILVLDMDFEKKTGSLTIESSLSPAKIKEAIEAEGDYTVTLK